MSESPGGDGGGGGGAARRRRRSGSRPAQADAQAAPQEPAPVRAPTQDGAPEPGTPADRQGSKQGAKQRPGQPRRQRAEAAGRDTGERALRDLVGAGRSQLGVDGALRGRDVNRPTDEDLAAAERSVVIVRRNWKPPDQ